MPWNVEREAEGFKLCRKIGVGFLFIEGVLNIAHSIRISPEESY